MNLTKHTTLPRILVIDDNDAIHEDFRKILEKSVKPAHSLKDMRSALFGAQSNSKTTTEFDIDYAFQGEEGFKMAKQAQADGRPYALAFVDSRMPPGWDGIETVRYLWQACPDLQIVICTAFTDYSWQDIHRTLGESDSLLFLKKPFDNIEVLQLAHALTRKWKLNRDVQGRLNQLAFYDSLTGLPNRFLFTDRLTQTLTEATRYRRKAALLFIDLDNFKRINDTLGHSLGDDLLKACAQRLVKCLRNADTVAKSSDSEVAARLGGDEFTVILKELKRDEDAGTVARRITQQLSQPVKLGSHEVIVTPSIGIAVFPSDGDNIETLIKNADMAMYYSKRMGPNAFKYYQESMNATALKRMTIENHLRQAIEREEFKLYYQPQFDITTNSVSGVEALLRWHNWELGDIPPIEFISIAEETGTIIGIGDWVLRTACKQAKAWLDRGFPLKRMAVNVSVKQFTHANFIETVNKVLAETNLAPHYLEIEVTESLLVKDTQNVYNILLKLKAMNIKISIDDFGTGYSNLSRLKDMPIDCLKIDRCFINGIHGGPKDQAIILAIIAMAKGMNLKVIAEGVETREQVSFLRENQCREVQGYLFSRPMMAEKVEAFLAQAFSRSNSFPNQDAAK